MRRCFAISPFRRLNSPPARSLDSFSRSGFIFALALAALAAGWGTCATAAAAPGSAENAKAQTPYILTRSEERFVTSRAGKEYRILISWPEGQPPPGGFPVCYVLDGDDFLGALTGMLRILAGTEKSSQHNAIQPGILVGIGYRGPSGRNLDYTPAAPKAAPETYRDGRPYREQESGGADAFFHFLQEELKPIIAASYPVDRRRQALLGNGYGGLFALHVLFTRPDAFSTYVAASPSIWWNGRYILEEEAKFAVQASQQKIPARLLITVGDLEQSLTQHEYSWPEAPREEHALKVTRRRMVDNSREMYWRLQKLAPYGLDVSYRTFPGESHKSVIPLSLSHALPFVFPPAPAGE